MIGPLFDGLQITDLKLLKSGQPLPTGQGMHSYGGYQGRIVSKLPVMDTYFKRYSMSDNRYSV